MRKTLRSLKPAAVCTAAWLALSPATGFATGYPVIDVAGIAQTALQITDTIAQVESMRRQLDRLRRDAQKLSPQTYGDLYDTLRINSQNYIRFDNQLGQLDSDLRNIDRLIPTQESLRNGSLRDHMRIADRIHRHVSDSSARAMHAQATARSIERNSEAAGRILSESGSNDS